MDQLEALRTDLVKNFSQWSTLLLFACVAIGFITMTFVEMMKKIVREKFNQRQIEGWLASRDSADDLIFLATAGDHKAFYNLSIENLCGQIVAAIQAMFESPARHHKLIHSLLQNQRAAGYRRRSNEEDARKEEDDFNLLINYERRNTKLSLEEVSAKETEFISVRSRLSTQIQRNLDAFQIRSTYQWQNSMRLWSLSISFLVTIVVAFLLEGSLLTLSTILFFVIAAYVAAFMASIFRDILSILERFKK